MPGDRGLLAILDESMLNRGASFAVAVGRDHRAFTKEVGRILVLQSDFSQPPGTLM